MQFDNHDQYDKTAADVKLVRDCLEGEPTIKRARTLYLKHPNAVDQDSKQQQVRYEAYIDGAEFDGYPAETEKAMLGKMTEGRIEIDLPDGIAHLENNSDGDGMPLSGAVETIYKNLLEVKYHILLAEYQGLADVDTDQLSIADLQALNPLATIKHYNREALIDWDFRRINGVMQLSLMVLLEESTKRDSATLKTSKVKSWLVLALDDKGDYYQQKFVEDSDGAAQEEGEKIYPQVGGQNLKWIPAEIVVDEETPAGKIPAGLGYLYPICSAALARYRVSADYKEALRLVQPTTFTKGWQQGDHELFKELNERDYIAFGAGVANNLPTNVEVEIKGLGVQTEPFENYFKDNERKARALGAKIDDGEREGDKSATQAAIESSQRTAVFQMIVNNAEHALKRVISYCAMYQGLWGADEVERNLEQIIVNLPRDFSAVKMTPDEVRVTLETVQSSLISKNEGIRKLVAGGFTQSTAEQILDELEQQGPALGSPVQPSNPGSAS